MSFRKQFRRPRRLRKSLSSRGSFSQRHGGHYKRYYGLNRSRNFSSYRGGAGAMASRALMLIRRFNKDEEVKEDYNSLLTNTVPLTDTWSTCSILAQVEQGASSVQRIGNKINMVSLAVRGYVSISNAETSNSATRVIIFYDRRPNGVLTTVGTDVLTSNSVSGMIKTDNAQTRGRFQILYDRVFTFPGTTAAGTRPSRKYFKFFIKKNLKTEYNNNTALIADFDKGVLLLSACSADASHDGAVVINTKYKYTDQ